jgi:hypothetical protein
LANISGQSSPRISTWCPTTSWGYRKAWVDAFRSYEIYPSGVKNLSEGAPRWDSSEIPVPAKPELGFDRLQFACDLVQPASAGELLRQARAVGALVSDPQYAPAFGLCPKTKIEKDLVDLPRVHSVRSARRAGPDGQIVFELVAEVTRCRRPRACRHHRIRFLRRQHRDPRPDGSSRYVIRKALTANDRLQKQRDALGQDARFWGPGPGEKMYPETNTFRMLHDPRARPM